MDLAKNPTAARLLRLGLPLVLLLAATLLIGRTDGDLRLARAVYGPDGTWPGIDRFPWDLLYAYAPVPAFLLAGAAAGILLTGFFGKRLASRRKPALFLLLLLALGPGLLVNVLLKDHLGRARPREVIEFGGRYAYTGMWQRGTTGANSSFPSGHAAVAFYLVAPWFVLRRRSPVAAYCWLSGGLGWGSLVGAARILQGAHFLSDVLWAGGLVYLSGELLAMALHLDGEEKGGPGEGRKTR